jgi:hypothetical protein
MLSETSFDDSWRNYCWLCEWEHQCHAASPCPYFQPPDWLDFQAAELVDDQDMRQAIYIEIIKDFGGEV